MASYRNIQKVGSYHIGSAHGAEYVISGRRGNWRVTLRSNTALGVGTAAPESFYADTLQEVDARLGEIASKIAAHRAKARKARHRVDVYDGGDEPVASYPFKTEADAQWGFDRASRGADEGVEMRLFLNGKEVERHTQPEKKRRSSRKPNSGVPDGWRPSLPAGWRLFLEGSWSESARKQYVLVSPDFDGRGKHALCVFGGQKPPHWSSITEERLREAEADRSGWLGTEIGLSAAPAAIQSEARREVREYEEERREAERRYGGLARLRNPNPSMTFAEEVEQARAEIAKVAASVRLWKRPAAKRSVMATYALAKPAIQAVKKIARAVYGDPPTLRWDIERSKIAINAIRNLAEEEAYLQRVLEQKTVTENDVSNASGILYNLERTLLRVIAFCLPPEY